MLLASLLDGLCELLAIAEIAALPAILDFFEKLLPVRYADAVFLKVSLSDDHLERSLFALTARPAHDLYEIRLILGNVSLNDMHSSLLVDLGVIDGEVCSSREGRTDEGDSVLCSSIVNQRVSHLRRHLFRYLVNVAGELIELR